MKHTLLGFFCWFTFAACGQSASDPGKPAAHAGAAGVDAGSRRGRVWWRSSRQLGRRHERGGRAGRGCSQCRRCCQRRRRSSQCRRCCQRSRSRWRCRRAVCLRFADLRRQSVLREPLLWRRAPPVHHETGRGCLPRGDPLRLRSRRRAMQQFQRLLPVRPLYPASALLRRPTPGRLRLPGRPLVPHAVRVTSRCAAVPPLCHEVAPGQGTPTSLSF